MSRKVRELVIHTAGGACSKRASHQNSADTSAHKESRSETLPAGHAQHDLTAPARRALSARAYRAVGAAGRCGHPCAHHEPLARASTRAPNLASHERTLLASAAWENFPCASRNTITVGRFLTIAYSTMQRPASEI